MFSMRKRFISLLLIFCLVFSVLPTSALAATATAEDSDGQAVSNPFVDVAGGDWYYNAVLYVYANNFFRGTTDTQFEPNGTMTRGMFVTVLGRMAGVDVSAYQNQSSFDDVSPSAYYAPYVAWAAKHGIAQGTGEGKFSPNDNVTRQQMAVFFVKYFENFGVDYATGQNISGEPADLDKVAAWAKDAVRKLWSVGLLNGDGKSFNPASTATRAECAMICYRADQAVKVWYAEPNTPNRPSTPTTPTNPTNPAKPAAPSTGGGGGGGSHGGGSSSGNYAVSFYDGDRLIDTLYAKRGQALGAVPTVGKSSKANAILAGYYTDAALTQPFYAENPVTGNMNVYAKYESLGEQESITIDSFAQMDQPAGITFVIKRISGNLPADHAATLAVKDGSDPVEIAVRANGDGTYTVSAPAGFNPGCSYELNLAEGWCFVNPDYPDVDTIRTAAFSIHMDEVDNLNMNKNIKYIQDTDDIDYKVGGQTYEVLSDRQIAEDFPDVDKAMVGTFNYSGGVAEGDIICLYVGVRPDERELNADALDPAVYVKVTGVNSGTVSFAPLEESDQANLYDVPDNFPMLAADGVLPTGDSGTINIEQLDEAIYAQVVGVTADNAKQDAKAKLSVGDFISIYANANSVNSEADVYFGLVTAVAEDGTITYAKSSRQAILASMDLYDEAEGIDGDDYITPAEKAEIERQILAQVQASDFGEEAAYLLADMVTKTDGFRNNMNVRDFLLTDENGQPLSDEEIRLLNLGGTFELSDDVKLTAELITSGDQLHFKKNGGVQAAIGVAAEFEVDAEEGTVHINLSATFVEEVAVAPSIKAKVVYKEVLGFIPFPNGVQINAIVDVRNYTAMSLKAEVFTEGEEEKNVWEKFQDFAKDPTELGNIPGLPDDIKGGLDTVGDALKKIDELKDEIKKGIEEIPGQENYIAALWEQIEAVTNGNINEEEWQELGERLNKTDVTAELMGMLDLTTDTELSTEYLDGMQALLDKYSEMMEKETDWIKLVEKEMFNQFYNIKGVGVGVQGKFIVRADMNIALGSNLEYEVGKRYNFWFKVGLFKPTSGSSTMDLLDEHFAYQFYVMGKLGVKAGVRLKMYAAIGGVDAISVGLTTELGPYLKLYGFFLYDYSRYRPIYSQSWVSKEQKAGALYLEFGLYLMVGVEAKALFLDYDKDFVDKEYPLLKAGNEKYYHDMNYQPEEGEVVRVINTSPDGVNPASMVLPDELRALKYLDLTSGAQGAEPIDYSNYNFTLSNPNFRLDIAPDNKSAKIVVTHIPDNLRYMPCDLTITYRHNKMPFSNYDMTTTVPLVWTNMTDADLAEFYTATVRVPDGVGGYTGVWSKRVRKNTEFDLPKAEEIRKLLSWNELKYAEGRGYGSQQTEGLSIIDNAGYNFDIAYQTYQLTVAGVQNEDGSTSSRTYEARYGEAFDLADLLGSGANVASEGNYTRFVGLTLGGENFDLNRTVNGKLAQALQGGATAQAEYADDSAEVTFIFTFVNTEQEAPGAASIKVRKGEIPTLTVVENVLAGNGLTMTGISPEVGAVYGDTVYQVVCELPKGDEKTITFDVNGGDALSAEQATIKRPAGSLAGTLPTPTRAGYTFDGWFTDKDTFANAFTETTQVTADITVYAKWTEAVKQEITVTFNVNGGDTLADNTKTVTVGEAYGELPTPEHADAKFSFIGWYTAPDGGEEVGATTIVSATTAHTLYAHWAELITLPREIFDFGARETGTYAKGVEHTVEYTYKAANDIYELLKDTDGNYLLSSFEDVPDLSTFTFKYKRQDDNLLIGSDYVDAPVGAGLYDVTISRPSDKGNDALFAKFEQTYTNVLYVERAVREVPEEGFEIKLLDDCKNGNLARRALTYNYLHIGLVGDSVDDLAPTAKFAYEYTVQFKNPVTRISEDGMLNQLYTNKACTVTVQITNDPNYQDIKGVPTFIRASDQNYDTLYTSRMPQSQWVNHWNFLELSEIQNAVKNGDVIDIDSPAKLAIIANMVNTKENDFKGKTIRLTADIDLYGYMWTPIGKFDSVIDWRIPFRGTFDGNGHTIRGLFISGIQTADANFYPIASLTANLGLFGYCEGAVIKNLTISDALVKAVSTPAILTAGIKDTTIENCIIDQNTILEQDNGGQRGFYSNSEYGNSISDDSKFLGIIRGNNNGQDN